MKKLAIADHLAQFADPVFADPAAFKSSAVWMAALAYAAQVYCDFSGYTDLALGSAHLLGYRLELRVRHAVQVEPGAVDVGETR